MAVAAVDERALAYVAKFGNEGFRELLQAGISADHFDEEYRICWEFIVRINRQQGQVPSKAMLTTRFESLELPNVRRTDLRLVLEDLLGRYKFTRFIQVANDAHARLSRTGWDDIDNVLADSVGEYTQLLNRTGGGSRLVNLFDASTSERMLKEMERRRQSSGIPTGIKELDEVTGGLHPGNMAVIIGRTGQGKTWLNLFFVANAVLAGHTAILYPLEMTLFETASRLYTIFSALMNPKRVLNHYELTHGITSERKLKRFLSWVEDRFEGRLYVSDTAHLGDRLTVERMGAEIKSIQPDMYWVDYITLMGSNEQGWEAVQALSHGIKSIAQDVGAVGGCSAQVNRAGMTPTSGTLPRLENIAYGDSIGQDADIVVSLMKPRGKDVLYWALVKNRHGREIGKRKLRFYPDLGQMQEVPYGKSQGGAQEAPPPEA